MEDKASPSVFNTPLISTMNGDIELQSFSSENDIEMSYPNEQFKLTFEDIKEENKLIMKRLVIVTIVSFIFMIFEVIGGSIANSLAILTDAARFFIKILFKHTVNLLFFGNLFRSFK